MQTSLCSGAGDGAEELMRKTACIHETHQAYLDVFERKYKRLQVSITEGAA